MRAWVIVCGLAAAATAVPGRAPAQPPIANLWAGGGIADFTGRTAEDLTRVGAEWDLRLRLRSRLPIALELGYVGTSNAVNHVLAADAPEATIIGHGVEADVL